MGVTLRRITEDDLEMIMNWRMSESVTKYMNTNPKLTLEGQKKWLASHNEDKTVRDWLILVDSVPAGVINLADLKLSEGTTSWGYYIGEESLRSLKLAISLEMSLYDYCFDVLGLEEVHNETFKLNEGVWKLHVACGCRIAAEVAGEVEKEGVKYDVVHTSVTRDEWLKLRESKKYDRINFDCFNDPIGGMKVHHLGIAVSKMDDSIKFHEGLGWVVEGSVTDDEVRNVKIAFMKHAVTGEMIELISPMGEESPVSGLLKTMRRVATPYHICYSVRDFDKTIEILRSRKYMMTDEAKPAVAIEGRRVAFMMNRNAGIIELLEEK
jgi:RimJ/RimL family protein N-acetyltransferase